MPSGTSNGRERKRGIQASRARLERALATAGLKTQAALAERIADLEDLDAAPKDLVNRVFRERPVDPQTLERVARGLGVEAYTLYKGSEENEPTRETSAPAPVSNAPQANDIPAKLASPQSRPSTHLLLIGFGVIALLIGLYLFYLADQTPPATTNAPAAASTEPLATVSVAVLEFDGDTQGSIAAQLREALREDFALISDASALLLSGENAETAARRMNLDLLLSGELINVGRHRGVHIYLHRAGTRQHLWSGPLAATELARAIPPAVDAAIRVLKARLGTPTSQREQFVPVPQVLDQYLHGRDLLDQERNELNVQRALTRFHAALRLAPDYPAAHAGLCAALANQASFAGQDELLVDAEQACVHALQLQPDLVEGLTALANIFRRSGRAEEAREAIRRALELSPTYYDAWLVSALVHLAKFRVSAQPEDIQAAIVDAERAIDLDPDFWKGPFALARMHYYLADIDQAIEIMQLAKALNPNGYTLSNLGTFHFCRGDHETARDYYLQTKEVSPNLYVGDVQLAVVHYFLEEYEASARLTKAAIEQVREDAEPEYHTIWGNYGDALRHIGSHEEAIDAYRRAAEICERDIANGHNAENTRAFLAYYYSAIILLDPAQVKPSILEAIDQLLDEAITSATDPSSLLILTQAYMHRGKTERARELFAKTKGSCPGYSMAPDLAPLWQN